MGLPDFVVVGLDFLALLALFPSVISSFDRQTDMFVYLESYTINIHRL